MERLSTHEQPTGMNGNALRTWGLLFLTAGVMGRGLIQNHILGIGQLSAAQLLEAIGATDTAMTLATLSLVLQALETCAAPIFALMLINGVEHTSDFTAYALRVTGLAAICELPYRLAMGGFAVECNRNPAFSLVLCLVMLYFFRRYSQKTLAHVLIKVVVTVAALLWGAMLKIDSGSCMVLITAILWAFRKKPLYRSFAGAAAAMVCTAISPFYLAAPMGFLAVHFYNGEKSTTSRRYNYIAYPAILVATAIVGMVL